MIYVDDAQIPYGRMKMCHMLADTHDELIAMAKKVGLDPRHIEAEGQPNEHFNLSMAYRLKAVRAGAKEIDSRGLVKIIRQKRAGVLTTAVAALVDDAMASLSEELPDEPETDDLDEEEFE